MIRLPAAPEPRVSIVIVTAKRPDRLVRCLAAVAREAPADLTYEAVVVLNGAEAGVRERLDTEVDGARVVVSDVPLGFAGGTNLGADRARGDLLHLLHDDTEVCPGWLEPLVALLDERPEVGAVGSLLLEVDGGVQNAGNLLWGDGSTAPAGVVTTPEPRPPGDAFPVDYCASASLLLRRSAWSAIGGLDEGLHPAYYVDVDLAMALRGHGYVVLCEPASRVRHERGGSSGTAYRSFVSERNRGRFVAKWEVDLARHHDRLATGVDARASALRAAASRADALAAANRTPAGGRTAAQDDDELAQLRREHAALRRDVAVKDAFIASVEDRLAEAAATRARLEADGATAQRALAEVHEANRALHREYAVLARAHEALGASHGPEPVPAGLRQRLRRFLEGRR